MRRHVGPDVLVVLRVAPAAGGVAGVHQIFAVILARCFRLEQHLAARGLDGRGGPRRLPAGAGVDLTVGLGAQPERLARVAVADLGEQLAPRRHGLRFQGLVGCRREHLGRDQPGQQLVFRDRVHHGKSAPPVDRDVDPTVVGPAPCPAGLAPAQLHGPAGGRRREPQHPFVAHPGAAARAGRLQHAVRPLQHLGVDPGGGQLVGRPQALERLLRRFPGGGGRRPHQHLAPIQHLACHREQRPLFERLRLHPPPLPLAGAGRRLGALPPLAPPDHRPVAQPRRCRFRRLHLPGLVQQQFGSAVALGQQPQPAVGTDADLGHPLGHRHRHHRQPALGEAELRRIQRAQLVGARELVGGARRRRRPPPQPQRQAHQHPRSALAPRVTGRRRRHPRCPSRRRFK